MKLYDIIKDVAKTSLPDMEISDVTSDTRKAVKAGSMFVCIKGKTFDGHDAAKDMIEKGCAVVVCERDLGLDCQIIVENTREAFPLLCAAFFGHPERELTLIGVTGTNGKTTITTVIKKVLSSFGCKVGLIGTCQNEIGVHALQDHFPFPAKRHNRYSVHILLDSNEVHLELVLRPLLTKNHYLSPLLL